jgi:hypothetical protein
MPVFKFRNGDHQALVNDWVTPANPFSKKEAGDSSYGVIVDFFPDNGDDMMVRWSQNADPRSYDAISLNFDTEIDDGTEDSPKPW